MKQQKSAKNQPKSMRSMAKEMSKRQLPTDIGLMPGTFVSPTVKELFRMYKEDRRMLRGVLWLRLKRAVLNPIK
jgi:mitochondrial protein MBA1